MTNGPNYYSDEEIVKRLQIVQRDAIQAGADRGRMERNVREARNLVAELAERIYREPERWGIADVPSEFRDDVAHDSLVTVLNEIDEFKAQQSASEWFGLAVEERLRELREVAERGKKSAAASALSLDGDPALQSPASIFDHPDGLWRKFEAEFQREAFPLRLRYMLGRSPEEMVEMMDAPSVRAVHMRLNRARDKFKAFCEHAGYGWRDVEGFMRQITEEGS